MTYTHLSQTERYQIYALMKAGHLPVELAKLLSRHKSLISRELSRNTDKRGYRLQQAKSEPSRAVMLDVLPRLPGRWLLNN